MKAFPIQEELSNDGKITLRDGFKTCVRILAEEYGWDITNARVLVLISLLDDVTKGFNILMKLKILMLLLPNGPRKWDFCTEEIMCSCRFNILDVRHYSLWWGPDHSHLSMLYLGSIFLVEIQCLKML